MSRAPVAVALDGRDLEAACRWAADVEPHVEVLKVGPELFCRYGPDAVLSVRGASRVDLMVDLCLHNIPSTVAGAARALARLRPRYVTVHAAGGRDMVRAAVDAAPDVLVTAVTVLTSVDVDEFADIGLAGSAGEVSIRRAAMAQEAGARALMCSAQDVAAVRAAVGPDMTIFTPGVRPPGRDTDDQARVATPQQALAYGADVVVVGRSITEAADPGAAAASLATTLRRAGFPGTRS